jgi:hypothetical protein
VHPVAPKAKNPAVRQPEKAGGVLLLNPRDGIDPVEIRVVEEDSVDLSVLNMGDRERVPEVQGRMRGVEVESV